MEKHDKFPKFVEGYRDYKGFRLVYCVHIETEEVYVHPSIFEKDSILRAAILGTTPMITSNGCVPLAFLQEFCERNSPDWKFFDTLRKEILEGFRDFVKNHRCERQGHC